MANQPATVTVTFNPTGSTLTCNPTSISVGQGNTGKITVNLQLVSGATGSIVFQSNPDQVTWSTPPPTSFNVTSVNSSQILITAPNGNPGKDPQTYSFQVNYTYTPVGGQPQSGIGDPSIVLEGTGANNGHGSEQGREHGRGGG